MDEYRLEVTPLRRLTFACLFLNELQVDLYCCECFEWMLRISVTLHHVFWYLSCIHFRCWYHIVIAVIVRLLVVQIICRDALQHRDSMSQCSSFRYDQPGLETGAVTRITFLCCALFKLSSLRKVKLYWIIRDFRFPWQCRRGFGTAHVGSWSATLRANLSVSACCPQMPVANYQPRWELFLGTVRFLTPEHGNEVFPNRR
jgi:hypothetical protein